MHRRVNGTALSLLALATSAALLLTGCSGGDSKKKPQDEMGPLDTYLMALSPADEMTDKKMEEMDRKTEDLVAKCMAKEGFEYTPNPTTRFSMQGSEEMDNIDWGSVEFAEKYGYGMIEGPWSDQPGEQDSSQSGDEQKDPNAEYFGSLSETQQMAYQEALSGPMLTEESLPEGETQQYDWKSNGCYGAAQHEIQGADKWQEAYSDPEFTELFAAIDKQNVKFYGDGTSAPTDPEMQKLDAKWASCMSDAGFPDYKYPNDAQNAINDEYNTLNGMNSESENPTPPSKAELDKLKKKEIAVAVPDAKCRKKVNYDEEVQKLNIAFQEKFVSEHKPALEALVAKYAPKKKSS